MRKRLLIISYLFPPAGGIAVQRALSLAKYLPDCGYDVHVLHAGNAPMPVRDPDLLRHVPQCVTVHSAFTPELPFHVRHRLWGWLSRSGPAARASATQKNGAEQRGLGVAAKDLVTGLARRVLCPEPEILWVPFAVRKARSIVRRYGIDAVLVTVPPFSALLVGAALKRSHPGIKLISDFRDEWLTFYLRDFEFQNSARTRRRAEVIERQAVEASDLVIAVAQSSLREIRGRYPGQPDSKFALLPNGYDPEVFAGFTARPSGESKMIVTHVGTAYKTASPRYYLDALDGMPEEVRSQIETRFIGRISESERTVLESRKSPVRVLGFMPQTRAVEYMERTDLLLLTMTNDISLPGKLFEYMATGKPILALTPQGSEVHRILQETGAGWCADPGDTARIQAILARAYDSVRAGVKIVAEDRAMVRRYERPRLAAEYGKLIGELFGPAATTGSSKEPASPAFMKPGRAPATHSNL